MLHTGVLSKVKALPYLTLCDHLQAGAVVRPHEAAGAGRVPASVREPRAGGGVRKAGQEAKHAGFRLFGG